MNRLILKGCEVYLQKYLYAKTNQICLKAFEKDTGFPFATLTINLVDYDVPQDHVVIKNYSENSGILKELINLGIVSEPIYYTSSGFVDNIPICKLLVEID